MRRATICMMVLTAVWGAANLLQSLFVCRFQHGKLNFLDKSQCEDQVPSFVASGLFNCTTNLIINLLPLYTIWSLRVTVSTRMGLTVIFVLSLKYVLLYFLLLLSLPAPGILGPMEEKRAPGDFGYWIRNGSLTCQFSLYSVTWASIVRIALLTRTVNSNEVFVRFQSTLNTQIPMTPATSMLEWFSELMLPPFLQKAVDLITFLTVLEVNLSILCNSLPMLLPLYSYWRYRKFFAEGEDEYVSRVRGGSEKRNERRHLVQSVANGLPLETIYGKDNVHFTATVIRGASLSQGRTEREQSVGRSASTPEDDGGHWNEDSESTRRLSRNAGAITIETKWTITESRKSAFDMD